MCTYTHQSKDKLDHRSLKCVFLGYPDRVKRYRFLVRDQPKIKILISKDVIFTEENLPCLKTNPIGTKEQQDTSSLWVQEVDYFEFEVHPPHDTFQF